MNPFVVRVGDEYWLYYSGGDAHGHQRICLASCPCDDLGSFTRHGPVLSLGEPGQFDAHWCVLPAVYRFEDAWYLYYSGREDSDLGLQSFPGIGLAISEDGIHFERYPENPIITGNRTPDFPTNRGVAGGGSIVPVTDQHGVTTYRMTYTLAVGTTNNDPRIDQEKHCALCRSADGIDWYDHRVVLSPRRDVPNEDIGVAAPFVWQDGPIYRMLYCGIGTRWGYYSISEAMSIDGIHWIRSADGGLALTPDADNPWEKQMVEYPCVVREGSGYRMFYCGNGYGATGIGTAKAEKKNGVLDSLA